MTDSKVLPDSTGIVQELGVGVGGRWKQGIKGPYISAVVITMFPVVWNAKNECFLYYKDIDLSHCKAISIYNAHVWNIMASLSFLGDLQGPGLLYGPELEPTRNLWSCSFPVYFQKSVQAIFHIRNGSVFSNKLKCLHCLNSGQNCYVTCKWESTLTYFIKCQPLYEQDNLTCNSKNLLMEYFF